MNTLSVSSSPHLSGKLTTRRLMLDVLISLVPAMAVAVFFWGPRALTLTLVTIAACVLFEYLYRKLMKQSNTVGDLSACVTAPCWPSACPPTPPTGWPSSAHSSPSSSSSSSSAAWARTS